jgi:hypothetical protein
MWSWFNCYLSGRHDYAKWCESGTIFLRCVHCGRRSSGWAINHREGDVKRSRAKQIKAPPSLTSAGTARVVPFNRSIAS